MKIAFITDNGKTISQHFGRASHYLVVSIENGQEVAREMREKLGHAHFASEHTGHEHGHGHEHHGGGNNPEAHQKHIRMAEAIADCETLVCRGMGMGAYESMKTQGIRPILTTIASIDEALAAYLAGNLTDHPEKLH
jgi:predicted Fe-Mo cluster-binding NifX family protein